MSENYSLIVFDLDGTLVDTASLSDSRRTPHDVLKYSPPTFRNFPFAFLYPLNEDLSFLIRSGIPVVVITRAPRAYASTVLQLSGLDFTECFPGSQKTPSEKLNEIAVNYGVESEAILYLGDQKNDSDEAAKVGVSFEYPFWRIQDLDAFNEAKAVSYFHKTVLAAKAMVEADEVNEFENNRSNLHFALKNGDVSLDIETFQIVYNHDNSPFEIQVFNTPFVNDASFKPAILNNFVTRFEYENYVEIRSYLLGILDNLFALLTIVPTSHNPSFNDFKSLNLNAFTNYMNRSVGQIYWQQCKDWRGAYSGPEVNLHLIELISLIFASKTRSDQALIPVPSSSFDVLKPGEVSRRIALRVAELANVDVIDVFDKDLQEVISIKEFNFLDSYKYVLVDDQLTTGRRIKNCLELLPIEARSNLSTLVWSVSFSRGPWMHVSHRP
jgi:phosphoglycolate phosphatase-like HAD superfamily hydrolase